MKEQSESVTQTLEQQVGIALRGHRAVMGLTLSELAERAQVSSGMISRIERGQVSASLSTLQSLADAMSMPIANLFGGTVESSEVSFVKAGEGVSVVRRGSTYGHGYKLLGKVAVPFLSLDPYLITIDRESSGQPLFQHSGGEYLFMLEGEMRYTCGKDIYALREGDSLCYDAAIPHGPLEIQTPSVSFLVVICARRQ